MVDRYTITFSRQAVGDLIKLRLYIEDKAGADISASYVDQIEAFCRSFETLPHRGTSRDDIRVGLRVAVFKRRVTIAYRISESTVIVLRVLSAGHDIVAELGE